MYTMTKKQSIISTISLPRRVGHVRGTCTIRSITLMACLQIENDGSSHKVLYSPNLKKYKFRHFAEFLPVISAR